MITAAFAMPTCGSRAAAQPRQQVAALLSTTALLPQRTSTASAATGLQPAWRRPGSPAVLLQRRSGQRRRTGAGSLCRAAAGGLVDVETARKLLDGPHTVLDIRSQREYDDGHITKPPRRSANVPFAAGQGGGQFVGQVSSKFPSKAAKLIVMCEDGGEDSAEAAELLRAAGYTDILQLEGGYAAYTKVWSPSGKRRPPSGRWVSTGKEALKSGLNIPGVAESYDEGGNLETARYAKGLDPGQTL